MQFPKTNDVRIIFPRAALAVIFGECDRFDHVETGGRVIGRHELVGPKTVLRVSGLIEAGPMARRTNVSLHQDPAFQEGIFRRVEELHPAVEHLGSWHTHHVTELRHLSCGDIETYHRMVNHPRHSIPVVYAVLVTEKHDTEIAGKRYSLKHYLVRRGEANTFEIPANCVEFTDDALIWPKTTSAERRLPELSHQLAGTSERAMDRDFIREYYPRVIPLSSEKLGNYWRGIVLLAGQVEVHVAVCENCLATGTTYSAYILDAQSPLNDVAEKLVAEAFPSVSMALCAIETASNEALRMAAEPTVVEQQARETRNTHSAETSNLSGTQAEIINADRAQDADTSEQERLSKGTFNDGES